MPALVSRAAKYTTAPLIEPIGQRADWDQMSLMYNLWRWPISTVCDCSHRHQHCLMWLFTNMWTSNPSYRRCSCSKRAYLSRTGIHRPLVRR